jgi:hypothetical protein
MSLQVFGPSGQIEGMLKISLKLRDVYQPPAMPGRFAPVPQTVEPNNIMAYTAGYPNGYNQAGGSQYPQYTPQYPPQYPQSYRPVMGPPGQYYPPAGPYAVPPPPPSPGLLGGLAKLLSAVRVGLDLEELAGAFGGGGCGGGGLGG